MNLKDLTTSELRELRRKIESELVKRTTLTTLQKKRIALYKSAKQKIYRNFKNPGNTKYASRNTTKLLKSYKLPTNIKEAKTIHLTFLKRQLKKLDTAFKKFDKKSEKIFKKASVKAAKELTAKEYEDFQTEIKKSKSKLKANYQKTLTEAYNHLEEVNSFIEEKYARLINLVKDNVYPDRTEEFKEILREKGYDLDKQKINYQDVFDKSLKQTFGKTKYEKYFGNLDEISSFWEILD